MVSLLLSTSVEEYIIFFHISFFVDVYLFFHLKFEEDYISSSTFHIVEEDIILFHISFLLKHIIFLVSYLRKNS